MRDRRVRLVALGLVAVFILSYLICQIVLISKAEIEAIRGVSADGCVYKGKEVYYFDESTGNIQLYL